MTDTTADLIAAARRLGSLLESIRDDQASPTFGSTHKEQEDNARIMAGFIKANATKVDDALAALFAAVEAAESAAAGP
jgi:hypothetical protein